ELVVTLAVFAIVLVVAGNYLFFGNRLFAVNEVKNTEKSIGDDVYSFMQSRLTYATKIEVNASGDGTAKYDQVFDVKDGHLYFGKNKMSSLADVYGDGYYGKYRVNYEVRILASDTSPTDYNRLELKVKVLNQDGAEVYETGSIIKCINLENLNKNIEVKAESEKQTEPYVNPVISYDESVSDDSIFLPTELWDRMDYTYTCLKAFVASGKNENSADKSLLPDRWIETMKEANNITEAEALKRAYYMSNDTMRNYISNRYYNGSWPTLPAFSDQILDKNPMLKSFVESLEKNGIARDKISYQVYINLPTSTYFGDGSFYVYVRYDGKPITGWYTVQLVYNHDNGKWYVGQNNKGIAIDNVPWDYDASKKIWNQLSDAEKQKYPNIKNGLWNQIQDKMQRGEWSEVVK
ncbi:MAG: hypothetical protein RR614_09980, partial [Eubacterium sp.]